MAGFFDKLNRQYLADFRGLYQVGKQRRRIRLDRRRITTKEQADAWAAECERLCRLLEVVIVGETVKAAVAYGAITEVQGLELMEQGGTAPQGEIPRLTIQQAALSHPSSRRDPLSRQLLYDGFTKAFCAHAGITYLDELTIDQVQDWIAHMQAQGLAWDTRRHRLMYVRRACKMAAAHGLPDVLAGLRLDRRAGGIGAVATWSVDELLAGVVALAEDPRARAVIVLGGLCGLRPSEIWRVKVGDLDLVDGILQVGRDTAKNATSRRALPLPKILAPWLKAVAGKRAAAAPLIATQRGADFAYSAAINLFRDAIGSACGRTLPLKALRKSFATWAIRAGCDLDLVEAWMGHRSSRVALITQRHYLERVQIDQLRPLATSLDDLIRKRMPKPRRKARKAKA